MQGTKAISITLHLSALILVCVLQVFRLLHHGRYCQRGIWNSGGLSEEPRWPVCPPCADVLLLFFLQAHHAVLQSVKPILCYLYVSIIAFETLYECNQDKIIKKFVDSRVHKHAFAVMFECVRMASSPKTIWFVRLVAFPFITAPLARFLPNKRRDQMNHFFINTIQKIIKQREEQPAEEVNLMTI